MIMIFESILTYRRVPTIQRNPYQAPGENRHRTFSIVVSNVEFGLHLFSFGSKNSLADCITETTNMIIACKLNQFLTMPHFTIHTIGP